MNARRLAVAVSIALGMFCSTGVAHPDHDEPGLLMHWAPDVNLVVGDRVKDVTGHLSARIVGRPRPVTLGPAQAVSFDGDFDRLLIAENHADIRTHLPTQDFTVSAWINPRRTQTYAGILSCFQDNGSAETGWLLGFDQTNFQFALSTEGGNDDGDGKLTYLSGKTAIEPGRWYHVAATYDGTTMRLYVNGELDAESTEQSGPILYPESAPVSIASYFDRNENFPIAASLHRIKLHDVVLTPEQLRETAVKNQNMIDFRFDPSGLMNFLVKPYLQFATQTSIVVMSESSRPSTMVVDYGKQQPLDRSAEVATHQTIGEVTLSGLEPQTTYFYRVRRIDTETGEELVSDVASFQTAVRDDMPWSFGVIGDTQRNPEITRKCADGLYGMRPNMLIHCGDVVDDGHAKNQWLKDLFEPAAKLFSHVAIFPVLGNHENDSHFYYDYFALPSPEYWYTFTYGNAQFFMIDTNRPTGPDSEQYKWLESELAKSSARWKFTVHHHPAYSSDEDDYGDTIKGNLDADKKVWGDPKAQPLIALYEKYGVDIAFAGHIHSYERTWPIFNMQVNLDQGVNYIVSGGGGGGLERAAPNRSWFMKHFRSTHHYCFATIHGDEIEFFAYDADGRLFDQMTLKKRPDAAK